MAKKKSSEVALPAKVKKVERTTAKAKTKTKKEGEPKRRSKKDEKIVLTKVKKASSASPPMTRSKSPGRNGPLPQNLSPTSARTTAKSQATKPSKSKSTSTEVKVIKKKRIQKVKTEPSTSSQPRRGRPAGSSKAKSLIQHSETNSHTVELVTIEEEPMDIVDGNQNHTDEEEEDEEEEVPPVKSRGWFRSCSVV